MSFVRKSLNGGEREVFLFDENSSLLDNDLLDQLMDLCNRSRHLQSVLIVHNGKNNDAISWMNSVTEKSWRIDLCRRLYKARFIMRMIKESPCNWIFFSQFSCLGFFAELSIACDLHVSHTSPLKFGFPEIYEGFYPFFGMFEEIARNTNGISEKWHKNPIRNISTPEQIGPQLFVTLNYESPLLDEIITWFQNFNAFSKKRHESTYIVEYYQDRVSDPLDGREKNRFFKSHWESISWSLKNISNRIVLSDTIVGETSRWLYKKAPYTANNSNKLVREIDQHDVYIDLSRGVVPGYVLCFWLSHPGISTITLRSGSSEHLKRSLTSLYSFIEKTGHAPYLEAWNLKVFWCVRKENSSDNFFSFDRYGRVSWTLGKEKFEGVLVSSDILEDSLHIEAVASSKDIFERVGFTVLDLNLTQHVELTLLIRYLISTEIERYCDEYDSSSLKSLESRLVSGQDRGTALEWDDIMHSYAGLQNVISKIVKGGRVTAYTQFKLPNHLLSFAIVVWASLLKSMPYIPPDAFARFIDLVSGMPREYSLSRVVANTGYHHLCRLVYYINTVWPASLNDVEAALKR